MRTSQKDGFDGGLVARHVGHHDGDVGELQIGIALHVVEDGLVDALDFAVDAGAAGELDGAVGLDVGREGEGGAAEDLSLGVGEQAAAGAAGIVVKQMGCVVDVAEGAVFEVTEQAGGFATDFAEVHEQGIFVWRDAQFLVAVVLFDFGLGDAAPAGFLSRAHVFPEFGAHAELVDVDVGELAEAQQQVAVKAGGLGEPEDMDGGCWRRGVDVEATEHELGELVEGEAAGLQAVAQAVGAEEAAIEELLGVLDLGVGARQRGELAGVPGADDVGAVVFVLAEQAGEAAGKLPQAAGVVLAVFAGGEVVGEELHAGRRVEERGEDEAL